MKTMRRRPLADRSRLELYGNRKGTAANSSQLDGRLVIADRIARRPSGSATATRGPRLLCAPAM